MKMSEKIMEAINSNNTEELASLLKRADCAEEEKNETFYRLTKDDIECELDSVIEEQLEELDENFEELSEKQEELSEKLLEEVFESMSNSFSNCIPHTEYIQDSLTCILKEMPSFQELVKL